MTHEKKGMHLSSSTEVWRCLSCFYIVGFVENKTRVRVKRRDLFVEVSSGDVQVNCPRCGKINHLNSSQNQKPEIPTQDIQS